MALILEYSFEPAFSHRRSELLAIVRPRVMPQDPVWAGVSEWLAAECDEAKARAAWSERQRQASAKHNGQPTPPRRPPPASTPMPRPEPPGDAMRAARLEGAFADLYARNRPEDPLRLLGDHRPRRERLDAAARAVVIAACIVDPDAEEWLTDVTDLARGVWTEDPSASPPVRGRGEVFRRRGHAALAMLEEACGVLGWPTPQGGPYREPGPVQVSSERLAAAACDAAP